MEFLKQNLIQSKFHEWAKSIQKSFVWGIFCAEVFLRWNFQSFACIIQERNLFLLTSHSWRNRSSSRISLKLMSCKLTPKLFLGVFAWKFLHLELLMRNSDDVSLSTTMTFGLSFLFSAACVIENHDAKKLLLNFPLSFHDIVTSRSLPQSNDCAAVKKNQKKWLIASMSFGNIVAEEF